MKIGILFFSILFIALAFLIYKKQIAHFLVFSDKKLDKNQKIKINYSAIACLLLNALVGILYLIKDSSPFGDSYFKYYIGTVLVTILMFVIINFFILRKEI